MLFLIFLLATLVGNALNFMIMSKHLQLCYAACADGPIISSQKFQKHGVIIGHLHTNWY